jgi:hypothetical protein
MLAGINREPFDISHLTLGELSKMGIENVMRYEKWKQAIPKIRYRPHVCAS